MNRQTKKTKDQGSHEPRSSQSEDVCRSACGKMNMLPISFRIRIEETRERRIPEKMRGKTKTSSKKENTKIAGNAWSHRQLAPQSGIGYNEIIYQNKNNYQGTGIKQSVSEVSHERPKFLRDSLRRKKMIRPGKTRKRKKELQKVPRKACLGRASLPKQPGERKS